MEGYKKNPFLGRTSLLNTNDIGPTVIRLCVSLCDSLRLSVPPSL